MNIRIADPAPDFPEIPQPRRKLDMRRRATPKPVATMTPKREDQAFLPADLEILETPPSPVRTALILIICTFVVVALVWSWLGHIEIIAIAQGKIQPTGRVKVIQPLETGKVVDIRVRNGQSVRAGEVLIELDRGEAEADEHAAGAALASSRAEAIRRRAVLDAAISGTFSDIPTVNWPPEIPANARSREERILMSDLGQLSAAVGSLEAQARQKQVERDRFDETIRAEQQLIAALKERVDMRSSVVASGGGSRSGVLDAAESLLTQQTTLTTQRSQRDIASANLDVLARERDKTIKTFIDDNSQKLAEAERQAEDLAQKLAKARFHSEHMTLTSPIDGDVLASTVTTVGQVLTVGEELMRIVPQGASLEVEGYLPNKDIGFVKPGAKAILKIDSFPFTRYGTVPAEVIRVGHDAIPEPEAQATETNGTQGQKPGYFTPAQRTQNLVFPLTLSLKTTAIAVDGEAVPLKPGMSVKIEIATGSRRILEYFFSPLVEVASEAIKER